MVSIRDVAKKSGFSPATVSFVLSNAPLARYISAETKLRVQAVAKQLGYRPNSFAQALRSQRSHTVGVMVFDMMDPFCTPILRSIEDSLYQASYLPILTDVHNEGPRFERYLEMLVDRRVEGLIVIANWLFMDVSLFNYVKTSRIPTVMIGHELRTHAISSVTVDNQEGARTAIHHLYGLGHRTIVVIRGPKMLGDTTPRWRGIRAFAKVAGLELHPNLIIDLPASPYALSSFECGFGLTEELLSRSREFTGIIAFDDMTALGAIRALSKARIKVPEQCSVIGFDDIAISALCTPGLTTIRQPLPEMGRLASALVLEAISANLQRKPFDIVHHKLTPELIVRDSTRLPPPKMQISRS
jgi:LacI family transcriptional regulator